MQASLLEKSENPVLLPAPIGLYYDPPSPASAQLTLPALDRWKTV